MRCPDCKTKMSMMKEKGGVIWVCPNELCGHEEYEDD
jgi:ribosomal protein L37AE/L43A